MNGPDASKAVAGRRPVRMVYTNSSANLHYYAEPDRQNGYLWAEVLRSDFDFSRRRKDGTPRLRRIPAFTFILWQHTTGIIGSTGYTPKTRPQPGALPDRTVTRVVRELLACLAYGDHELTVRDIENVAAWEPLREASCSCGWSHTATSSELPRRHARRLHDEHVAACRALAARLPGERLRRATTER